jgi:hypothetical protein
MSATERESVYVVGFTMKNPIAAGACLWSSVLMNPGWTLWRTKQVSADS